MTKKKVEKEETVPVLLYFPDSLQLAFKSECAKYRGLNMSAQATELVRDWLRKRGVEA